jgi:hypothetical protein
MIEQRWRRHRTFAASSPAAAGVAPNDHKSPAAWMRRGQFVYCRRTQRRRQHNDGGATTGAVGEAQQAPNGGADHDGGRDVTANNEIGIAVQRRRWLFRQKTQPSMEGGQPVRRTAAPRMHHGGQTQIVATTSGRHGTPARHLIQAGGYVMSARRWTPPAPDRLRADAASPCVADLCSPTARRPRLAPTSAVCAQSDRETFRS